MNVINWDHGLQYADFEGITLGSCRKPKTPKLDLKCRKFKSDNIKFPVWLGEHMRKDFRQARNG